MSALIASISLPPDPGNRLVLATYHGMFNVTVQTQNFDITLKQNGSGMRARRWQGGNDPTQIFAELTVTTFIGPQAGSVLYTVEIDWGAGGGGQVVTYADPNFNGFTVTAWPAGGT